MAAKRFLLFVGDLYYPMGGWSDLQESFDTLVDALSADRDGDWWHVVDLQTGKVVQDHFGPREEG